MSELVHYTLQCASTPARASANWMLWVSISPTIAVRNPAGLGESNIDRLLGVIETGTQDLQSALPV